MPARQSSTAWLRSPPDVDMEERLSICFWSANRVSLGGFGTCTGVTDLRHLDEIGGRRSL
jgi:hypothetical protein